VATKKNKKAPAARTATGTASSKKPPARKAAKATKKTAAKKAAKVMKKTVAKKAAKATKKTVAKKTAKATKKTAAQKTAAKKTAAKKTVAKKTVAKKTAAKKTANATKKTVAKKTAAKNTAKATKKTAPQTATIVQHVFVPASPAAVYAALTDPAQHGAFTGTECTGAPVVGGTYIASSGYIHGRYLEILPNRRVVSEWITTEWPRAAPPSRLEIDLEGSGGGTELTMTHTDVPASQAEDYRQGWLDYYWLPLRQHFAARR
jgi:uncharacterized protein YndB with AHSA1/START domain